MALGDRRFGPLFRGLTDDDPDIELPNQNLEGVYFFTQYRWAVNRETRYVIGNGTGWGMNTMLDTRGDGVKVDPPDENFRAQFAWHGNFPQFTTYDNIGGPIWDPSNSSGYVGVADSVGRLGSAHFVGVVTIEAFAELAFEFVVTIEALAELSCVLSTTRKSALA